jgi:nucleoside 2-deoxyribosyltransferase
MQARSIYLAAKYPRRDEMRRVARKLLGAGFTVTSRWLYEDKPLNTQLGDDTDYFYRQTAWIDVEDIDACDTIVFFSEDPRIGVPRGGRHFEFGYAYAAGKRMVVIGEPENIFHYLTDVFVYPTVQDFIESEGNSAAY